MHIALGIEYDGSQFHGYQKQPGLRTVQGELENAISNVANERIHIHCAGRTDTGVHALGQVIHFETNAQRHDKAWIYGCNSQLPKDVCVRWGQIVDDQFHARYSALSRRYLYVIYNNKIRKSLFSSYLTWQYRELDAAKMHDAAQLLIGKHDFSSFRAIECQSPTPIRTITHFTVERRNELVLIDVTANAFLHHMVRNMAGSLISIGCGRNEVGWIKEVLAEKDRVKAAETAPAYGLYLMNVEYPSQYSFPKSSDNSLLFGLPRVANLA